MNPARSALDLVARPAGAVAHALNRPTAFGRNRPLYGLNLLDALRGDTLEDALRDRIVLITGRLVRNRSDPGNEARRRGWRGRPCSP